MVVGRVSLDGGQQRNYEAGVATIQYTSRGLDNWTFFLSKLLALLWVSLEFWFHCGLGLGCVARRGRVWKMGGGL